jgi:AraC-like DNA-binding protein
MNIEDHIPATLLQPFIRTYKIIECQDEQVNRVLPDTACALAFRYKGQVNYLTDTNIHHLPSTVITGLRTSVRLINYLQNTATIIVQFKEGGAAAFFREPLHELFGESVSLDNFISQQKILLIEEQLAEATNNKQRIGIIEHFLLSILHARRNDQLITDAIEKITATKGIIKIKELAAAVYLSQDAFEKRFRKLIGTSPKQFSSIIRMKSITSQIHPTQPLTDIALQAGYFDQPHFNKDFRRFTGLSPTDFFNSPSRW